MTRYSVERHVLMGRQGDAAEQAPESRWLFLGVFFGLSALDLVILDATTGRVPATLHAAVVVKDKVALLPEPVVDVEVVLAEVLDMPGNVVWMVPQQNLHSTLLPVRMVDELLQVPNFL
eukprot:CAMPEP_0196660850 /NCGR_PEP_ID=MMETSP1086-20130531/41581_1 /TAXON_ID=77921 /ORGANISM="Cyanoptyche  gloeocystis , Strain SAG4.97" /LENGTH=118 /DNA_ID=CAMNT_0041995479 /DNA_START=160 /DNA_END=516 /DNA_ORIENTATION=+